MKNKLLLKFILSTLFLLILSGCKTTNSYTHVNAEKPSNGTAKILVMPVEVEINTLTASGDLELEVDLTEQAKSDVTESMFRQNVAENLQLIAMPELSSAHEELVNQHIALYDSVGYAAMTFTKVAQHKAKSFDYSLGNGLAFLKEYTDADLALFVNAYNTNSSGGRIAAAAFAAMWGVAIPMGVDFAIASVVDLESGDILWFSQPQVSSLQNIKNVDKFTQRVLENYEQSVLP